MDIETTLAIQSVFNELNKYCTKTEYATLKDSVVTLSNKIVTLESQVSALQTGIANINKLIGLLDVNITNVQEGDILQYSNNKWVNVKASSLVTNLSSNITLSSLTDVSITGTPTIGQLLKFNGTKWANANGDTSNIISYSQIQAFSDYTSLFNSDVTTLISASTAFDSRYLKIINGVATNLTIKDSSNNVRLIPNATGVAITGDLISSGETTAYKIG